MRYFCQNLKQHNDHKPVEVFEGQKFCPECLDEMDWMRVNTDEDGIWYSYADPQTRPIYPLNKFVTKV